MASIVSVTVQWIIVPCVMLVLLVYALRIAAGAGAPDLKRSAWAGFWAGLLVSVIYVISQSNGIQDPDFNTSGLPGLLVGPLSVGLVAGFVFLWLVRVLVPTRVVGLITLLLSATSTSALFTYVFVSAVRVSVLYASLGLALGILLHVVLFPSSLRGASS